MHTLSFHTVDKDLFTRTYWDLDSLRKLTGEDTVIAILDRGINMEHSAFKSPDADKVLPAPNYSKNFHHDQPENDITDHTGHGTLCAGIAAGISYGNTFLRLSDQQYTPLQEKFPGGVAPQAKLIVCRIDYSEDQVVKALDHLIDIQTRNENPIKVHVVSMSFGFDKLDQQIEARISDLTWKHGTICVASAGNEGQKLSRPITYPGSSDNVICIGAHDNYGHQAQFSSTGQKHVYLAPGEKVIGPVPHTQDC